MSGLNVEPSSPQREGWGVNGNMYTHARNDPSTAQSGFRLKETLYSVAHETIAMQSKVY